MKTVKKILGLFLCFAIVACVAAGCQSRSASSDDTDSRNGNDNLEDGEDNASGNDGNGGKEGQTIALAFPTQSATRWTFDAENMQKELEQRGYKVKMEFAEDDPQEQIGQVEQFIKDKVDCIVVTAID